MYRLIDHAAEHYLPEQISSLWWSLGMAGPKYVLYLEIVAAAVLWLWLMHRGYRWAKRQKKVMGSWWSETEYRNLIQHLADEEKKGRVLAFEEINALNEYRHGKNFQRIVNRAYGNRLD